MASVDPYGPCPCGSGQKYKWCCQKIEVFAERSRKQLENGQNEAALATLDEGLKADPGNPWLGIRKALLLGRQRQAEEAKAAIASVLSAHPDHVQARAIYIQSVLQTDGTSAAVGALQTALSRADEAMRGEYSRVAEFLGMFLSQVGLIASGLKHLYLGVELAPQSVRPEVIQLIQGIEASQSESLWMRQPYDLDPAPDGLNADRAGQFAEALEWAEDGRWSDAAAAFQLLAGDDIAAAERNLAICRLWLVDDRAAFDALGRYLRLAGDDADALDIEVLRQELRQPSDDELVDHVQLIWSLRGRDLLMNALTASDRVSSEGRGPLDPDAETQVEVDYFTLLDRPKPASGVADKIEDQPRILGRVLVGKEIVVLDAFDDGRLDDVSSALRDLAGTAIPPAHPKTKEIGKIARSVLRIQGDWWSPPDLPPDDLDKLQRKTREHSILVLWPETPLPELNGRTPVDAAKDAGLRLTLRAALAQLEQSQGGLRDEIDFAGLRNRLSLDPEPLIQGESVDINAILPSQLHLCVAESLSDENLAALYDQGRRFQLDSVVANAARAIVQRPDGPDRLNIGYYPIYVDLANMAAQHGSRDEAIDWVRRGFEADPQGRATNAVRWELLDIRIRGQFDPPEVWVPQLAVILDRYKDNQDAAQHVLSGLVEMGLVRMSPHPENPDQVLIDSRLLQAVLAEYGPRITTASGQLGVSASKGGIWTPGSDAGTSSGGGLWTPGGGTAGAPADKPKLIIPGR